MEIAWIGGALLRALVRCYYGIVYMSAAKVKAFREGLGEFMWSLWLRVSRSFTPHRTVAYERHVVAEHAVGPVRWRAWEFVMIRSHVGQGIHEVLGRWPLAK